MSDKYRLIPFVLLSSLIAACIEIDVSVPGFPLMADYFNATELNVQLTLTINFLGFCLSCLFYGPLSDSFGRKKVMLFGFCIFTLASLICSVVPSLPLLILARFFQGFGASAVWVVAFAIVADVYKGEKAINFIGLMNTVLTGALAVAPVIGALICNYIGWRATYGFIAILSFVSLLVILFFLPETNNDTKKLDIRKLISDFATLLRSYKFMTYCLAPSILCAAYMAYIGTASFLYIDKLGMSFGEYAIHQSLVIGSFSATSLFAGRIQSKLGDYYMTMVGIVLSIVGILLIIPFCVFFPKTAISVTSSMMLYAIGIAICYAVIFAKSLEIFPAIKGVASSVLMAFRILLCGIGIWLSGVMYTGSLLDTAEAIAIIALFGIIISLLVMKLMKSEVTYSVSAT